MPSEDYFEMDHSEENLNSTNFKIEFSPKHDIFPILFAILIIAANALVHFLVVKSKHLRNTANYMLCSLALSDLLTGLVGIPLYLACNIVQKTTICVFADAFIRFTSISTVLHLLTITADRYLAIIHSLRYYLIVTPRRAYITLSAIWLFSIFVSCIQLIWNSSTEIHVHGEGFPEKQIPYDMFNLVCFFILPLAVTIFVNSRIFYEVVRQSHIMRQNNTPGTDDTRKKQRREWKAALIFALMFITYCVCWLPFFLATLQHNIGNSFFELTETLEYVFVYSRFATSLINPCLYVLGKNDFRNALKRAKKDKKRGNSISKSSVTKYSFLKTSSM